MDKISIRHVPISEIEKDESNFNSNNHSDIPWDEPLLTPTQYDEIVQITRYSNWKDILKLGVGGHSVWLSRRDCSLILEACQTAMFTGRIPASIAQDIDEEVTAKIRLPQRVTASSPEYFVRLDECSTKDGVGGVGPFTTAHEVVKALCTSKRVGQALKRVLRSTEQRVGTYLHLLPWKPFDETNEFRAFIAQRRLVALSQYKWKEDLGWADPSRERMLQEIVADVETLVSELNQRAQNADKNMPECYVLDVHVSLVKSEDEQVWSSARVEPIELNSFGAQMAAGSALFHWIHDHQRLYGLLDGIEVRVVSSANHGDNDEVENVYK